ncbi:MAG: HigA family addiction module antidote protein [Lachnospiraceae bacterium]|nr:HigA family addiction module antidote protein [Lachnospiraceae bacterium]
MAAKITGISRDLMIHPGETIADVLEDRGITQAELATRTGTTPAYVSNVIAGKKDISTNFAMALEYALGVPKSFWLNLQANYDAELLELNQERTITEEERAVREMLADVVKYLRKIGKMPAGERKDASILSLRKALGISDISRLGDLAPGGAFRISSSQQVNPYVLGAWIRLCQMEGEGRGVETRYDASKVDAMITEIKKIMLDMGADIQTDIRNVMKKYGIDFSVAVNFRGAPVQGYLSKKSDGTYQMIVTIRGSYADIFWFSLFHEIGHIVNGDVGKGAKFLDDGSDTEKEKRADLFASNKLLDPDQYQMFVAEKNFTIESIERFAASQDVMPYIVIGRLQKEQYLRYDQYSRYKLRFKWAE